MCLFSRGRKQPQTGIICKEGRRQGQKQATLLPAEEPTWHQHIHYWTIPRWKRNQLHIMPSDNRLCQPAIRMNAHLKIAIECPILMTANGPKPIELQWLQEALKVRFIGETIPLIEHPGQQFFSTAYDRRIRSHRNETAAKSTATAPMIAAISSSCDSRIMTLAETHLHQQRIAISARTAKTGNVGTYLVPLEIFEYRERRGYNDRSITMTTLTELFIWMHQHILLIHWTQQIVPCNQNQKNIRSTTRLRHDLNTSRNAFSSGEGLTDTRIWDNRTTTSAYNDIVRLSQNTAPCNCNDTPRRATTPKIQGETDQTANLSPYEREEVRTMSNCLIMTLEVFSAPHLSSFYVIRAQCRPNTFCVVLACDLRFLSKACLEGLQQLHACMSFP